MNFNHYPALILIKFTFQVMIVKFQKCQDLILVNFAKKVLQVMPTYLVTYVRPTKRGSDVKNAASVMVEVVIYVNTSKRFIEKLETLLVNLVQPLFIAKLN